MDSEGRRDFDRGAGQMMDNNMARMRDMANNMTNMSGGKLDLQPPQSVQDKFAQNLASLLQLPPDRFAELTKNINMGGKEAGFTGNRHVPFCSLTLVLAQR